jgi:hypothetical protein
MRPTGTFTAWGVRNTRRRNGLTDPPPGSSEAGDLTLHWAKRGPDVALIAARWALGAREGSMEILDTIDPDESPSALGLA